MDHAERVAKAFKYLTEEEVRALKDFTAVVCLLAKGKPVIVNIGAGTGTSGLAFREACPDALLYSVDFRRNGPIGGLNGERNEFENSGLRLPNQLLGRSEDIGKAWNKGEINLLFVDADHERPGITGDIEAWLPHVKVHGYILFHDYGSNDWPDVRAVVNELMHPHTFVGLRDTVAIYQKRF